MERIGINVSFKVILPYNLCFLFSSCHLTVNKYRGWSNNLSSHEKVDFVGSDVKELDLWFKDFVYSVLLYIYDSLLGERE